MCKGRKWQRVVAGVLALFMGASLYCSGVEADKGKLDLNNGAFRDGTATKQTGHTNIDDKLTTISKIEELEYTNGETVKTLDLTGAVEQGFIRWNDEGIAVDTRFPAWVVFEKQVPLNKIPPGWSSAPRTTRIR